jgi:tetratricopeptide (TPR) repeat protein
MKGNSMTANRRVRRLFGLTALVALVAIVGCESVGLRSMRIYMQQQNWSKALEQGLKATQDDPTDVDAWFNVAAVAAQIDSYDVMLLAIDETLEQTDKYNAEIAQIRTAEYNDLFNGAVQDFNNDDFEKAKAKLELALRINSSRANAPKLLGMIAQRNDDIPGALAYYRQGLDADTTDCDLARQYAMMLNTNGDTDQAISVMKRTHAANLDNKDVAMTYISLLQADKQFSRSRQVVESALERMPEDADFNMVAGVVYMSISQTLEDSVESASYVEMSIPKFAQVLVADSANGDAAFNLAMSYRLLGQFDKATEPLHDVVAFSPDDRQARMQLVRLLLQLDKPDEAEPHLQQLLEQVGEPTNAEDRATVVTSYKFLEVIYMVRGNNVIVDAQNLRHDAQEKRGSEKTDMIKRADEMEAQSQELFAKTQEMKELAKMYDLQ